MSDRFGDQVRAVSERATHAIPGWTGLLLTLGLKSLGLFLFAVGVPTDRQPEAMPLLIIAGALLFMISLICWNGLFIVQPNQAEVLVLFGRYLGSIKQDGWYFVNPLVTKKKISLRVHNFNSVQLKVNDADGNPIEIAAVVVWRVVDTARAMFDVEDYTKFVEVQAETAIRHLASQYPYDAAIIAARQKIVEGAVSMVEMALGMLAEKQTVELTAERKADLVSNLLVVLTSDRAAHPMVPVGSK